jgi:hypothetical protein
MLYFMQYLILLSATQVYGYPHQILSPKIYSKNSSMIHPISYPVISDSLSPSISSASNAYSSISNIYITHLSINTSIVFSAIDLTVSEMKLLFGENTTKDKSFCDVLLVNFSTVYSKQRL